MKSVNFKRQESVIRYAEEKGSGRKKINWDRIIYFLILGTLIFLLIRWVVLNTVYIEANGQVVFESRKIQNVDDSRIIEFKVDEGDEVEIGDTLFTYINDEDDFQRWSGGGGNGASGQSTLSVGDITINKIKSPDWIDREIMTTKKHISLNRTKIQESEKIKSVIASNLDRMEQEVVLDVIPKSKLDDHYLKIADLEAEILQMKNENGFYAQYINELNALKAKQDAIDDAENKGINLSNSSSSGSGDGEEELLKYFMSPIDGTVTRIFKESFEVALKSEEIMSIHKPENIKIKAYVEQEDIGDLRIGDELEVIFPDGTDSEGFVDKFHFTTSRLPEEFQKKYEPTTRTILVDIVPKNPEAAKKWQAYYKMGVIVRKSKF